MHDSPRAVSSFRRTRRSHHLHSFPRCGVHLQHHSLWAGVISFACKQQVPIKYNTETDSSPTKCLKLSCYSAGSQGTNTFSQLDLEDGDVFLHGEREMDDITTDGRQLQEENSKKGT